MTDSSPEEPTADGESAAEGTDDDSGFIDNDERIISATKPSETMMQWLVLSAAYLLVVVFAIGVFDLLLILWDLVASGQFTDPVAVIGLIDTVLLLLIIVEVHRTLIAIARSEPVTRIVINVAVIAVARQVISFRIGEFDTAIEALAGAGAIAALLLVLTIAIIVVRSSDLG
ncbi:MAG: phosphate-starvation-inducible PsiE family protein [Natronomonas sp.]